MSTENADPARPNGFAGSLLYVLALMIVIVGLLNALPGVPGLDQSLRTLTGWDWFTIRKYPTEWFYPIAFAAMMICVALRHSIWRSWRGRSSGKRILGLCLDIALVTMALGISLTYVVEIESICLIDQITGERQALIAEALAKEIEIAQLYGLPEPTSVEDPQCVNTTGGFLVLIVGAAVLVFLSYNIKVWGLPLVLVAMAVALYTIATVLVWYVHGPDDINKYLMTKLAGEPRLLSDGRPKVHDILVNNASGLLGRFMDIMLNTIFPYLVLGSLFWCLGRRAIPDQAGLSLDPSLARWPGACGHRVVGHVWHCIGRANRQRSVNGRSDYPDDAKTRLFQGVRRWC